jgi:phosphohistidine phosphatase SixA
VSLVGHDPHLSVLAALLLAGPGATVNLALKKGGAFCLSCPGRPAPGKALLRWSVDPKILTALDLSPS